MHAVDFLKKPPRSAADVPPVVAAHGDQRLLKRRCVAALAAALLGEGDEPTKIAGETADLAAVLDELRTVSMFSAARVVVVEAADGFVSENRAGLERYVESPAADSALILDVEKWPKNTRLAKAIAKRGLDLECKELTAGRAAGFLTRAAKDEFDTALPRDAADLLVQFAGTDLGLLEQELGKLCSFAADRDPRAVTAEDVVKLVGDSSIRNVFAMLGDVRRGDLGGALAELDKLLAAGEAPFKILGGLGFAVRKLAAAADVAIGGGSLPAGLAAAGVFPKERGESEAYLKRIGRGRAAKLRGLLLDADGDLRGGSALPDRAVLERLLVELAGPTGPLRR